MCSLSVINYTRTFFRPRRFGVFITPAADFDITEKLLDTMEPGSLSEPMVTNEMERIAINVKDADHKMECEQKSESGSMEKTAAKSDKTNHTEELPPFVPLQRATQSSPNRESHTVPSRADKKSPKPRKRSQPVRGDLIPDPDKLLSYKKHEGHKKEEEEMEDPTVPGGMKPREPRLPGDEAAERKKSTVTFSTVVETIDA